MGNREYWMVQWRAGKDSARSFKFCESRLEAETTVAALKKQGFRATYWQL